MAHARLAECELVGARQGLATIARAVLLYDSCGARGQSGIKGIYTSAII